MSDIGRINDNEKLACGRQFSVVSEIELTGRRWFPHSILSMTVLYKNLTQDYRVKFLEMPDIGCINDNEKLACSRQFSVVSEIELTGRRWFPHSILSMTVLRFLHSTTTRWSFGRTTSFLLRRGSRCDHNTYKTEINHR